MENFTEDVVKEQTVAFKAYRHLAIVNYETVDSPTAPLKIPTHLRLA